MRHFTRINQNPLFKASRKIFIPENNLGMAAGHMEAMVTVLDDVTTFYEKPNRPGIWKTEKRGRDYVFTISSLLMSNSLLIAHDFFTTSSGHTAKTMIALARDQLERFHWEKRDPHDKADTARWKITGKMGDKNDDLVQGLGMAATVGHQFISDPRHSQ